MNRRRRKLRLWRREARSRIALLQLPILLGYYPTGKFSLVESTCNPVPIDCTLAEIAIEPVAHCLTIGRLPRAESIEDGPIDILRMNENHAVCVAV